MYKHPETGIEFAETIGSFKRDEIANYGGSTSEPGVAVPYRATDVEATVFIRYLGPDSPKTAATLVEESLNLAKAMEQNGKYQKLKIYGFPDTGKDGWDKAAFTAHFNNMVVMSFIYCIVKSEYAIKLRITNKNPKNEEWQSFIRAIQDLVEKAQPKP